MRKRKFLVLICNFVPTCDKVETYHERTSSKDVGKYWDGKVMAAIHIEKCMIYEVTELEVANCDFKLLIVLKF